MEKQQQDNIQALKKALTEVALGRQKFQEYLNLVHEPLTNCLVGCLQNSRTCFESEKHKDVDKYLYAPLMQYLKNTGKLHRPALCLASFLMNGGNLEDIEPVVYVACAIEVFQAAALIHDDIADNATLRRNEKCFHLRHGLGIGINSGDFALSMVVANTLLQLSKIGFSTEITIDVISELSYMEYMTTEGQAIDLGWARDERFDLTVEDYFTMARKKTAYYSCSAPCVLGALCAKASNSVVDSLREFGLTVGVAFQIQDDILNLSQAGNKDFRNDITEGKRTLMVVHSLNNSSEKNKETLKKILTKHTKNSKKLENAVKIIEQSGSFVYANSLIAQLVNSAQDIIDNNYNNR